MSTRASFPDKASKRPTARSRALRRNATDAERKLWARLSARQVAGTRFNRQVPIGPLICDFVSRSARLVIEADGGQHAAQEEADRQRSAYLHTRGYRVVRFWNNDIIENIDGVVEMIERILRTSPPPAPPASGRGER